jgi:hypothetical protein
MLIYACLSIPPCHLNHHFAAMINTLSLSYFMLFAVAMPLAVFVLLPCCCCAVLMRPIEPCAVENVLNSQLRTALGKSMLSQNTSPFKRPRRHSTSSDRGSKSPSPTLKRRESPRKRLRSRSPPHQGKRQRDFSARKTGNRENGSFFRNSTGSRPSGVCAVCLGRNDHDFSKCNSARLWDGTKGWARKNEQGRLATPEGLVLCFDWQLPKTCASTTHTEKHLCSGCGEASHGAQKCLRAEKL